MTLNMDDPLEREVERAMGRFEADLPLISDPTEFNRRPEGYHVDILALGQRDWSEP